MMKRLIPLLALPLAACSSSSSEPARYSAVDTTPVSTIAAAAPVQTGAHGLLQISPEAGPILQVRERDTTNGFHQDLVLAYAKEGHPENRIEIDVITRPNQKGGAGKPTEAGIRSEILSRYPGVPMKIVLKPKENGLGTFGLAVGVRSDGARCVFAWQWVDDIRDSGGKSGFSKMMARSTPASVRVAMCRRDLTLDTLATLVESLSLSGEVNLDQVIAASSMTRVTAGGSEVRGNAVVADMPASLESLVGAKQPVV